MSQYRIGNLNVWISPERRITIENPKTKNEVVLSEEMAEQLADVLHDLGFLKVGSGPGTVEGLGELFKEA